MNQLRKRLTYANVMSSIAVFLVIGGGAAFAALGKNTVGTKQLKKNAVKVGKIGPEAVKAGKLAQNAVATNRIRDGAVSGGKIANEAVGEEKIGKKAVTEEKIGKDAVTSEKILDSAVNVNKLAADSVSTGKIVDSAVITDKLAGNSVTAGKLGTTSNTLLTKSVPANGTLAEIVTCPAGGRVLSGGYFTSGTGVVQVTRFRPNGTTGWAFTFKNNSGTNSGVDIYAVCLLG